VTWLLLAVLAFVIVWNGFFVAAEYAFVASRPSALAERANDGSERAADVIALQQDPTRFVAAVQVAITMSSLAAGAIGEPAVRSLLEPLLDPVGDVTGRIIATTISIAVAFAIVTALTVVLGEIIPKTFTLGRAEQVALLVIRPVQVFNRVFRPFIALLSWLSRLATRALGLPEPEPPGRGVSAEELKQLVAASREEGVLEAEASEMINRVVDFGGTEVRQVMVPRPDVVALSMEETVDGAVELIARFPHTRYPIFESDLDDVAGIVHARELLEATRAGRSGETLRSLARPSHFVPETATLDEVMRRLRRQRARMAIVLDEYWSL
jgi:CBS domain containing-hemolysin-like protein